MGLTLTNEQIDLTYAGLIKMNDNVAVTGVLKPLSDGLGNNLPIEISTTGVNFTGTVTGISAGGLVPGTVPDSMRSSDALTTTPAVANQANTIALGNNVNATAEGGVAIGKDATVNTSQSVAIGYNVIAQNGPSLAVGRNSTASGSTAIAIGNGANVTNFNSIGISGEICTVSGQRSVGIGRQATATAGNALAIGNFAKVTGDSSMSFTSCTLNTNNQKAQNALMMVPGPHGCNTNAAASDSIVLGSASSNFERATAAAVQGIAIGRDTQTTAAGAVALGDGVVANKDATVSVTELEVQLNGGGISMFSPNGTEYKLTVSDAGALVIS